MQADNRSVLQHNMSGGKLQGRTAAAGYYYDTRMQAK